MFVEKTAQNIKLNIIFIKVFQSDFRSFHSTVICIVLLSLTPYACMGKSVPRPMHICLINVVLDQCPSSLPPQFVSSLIPCACSRRFILVVCMDSSWSLHVCQEWNVWLSFLCLAMWESGVIKEQTLARTAIVVEGRAMDQFRYFWMLLGILAGMSFWAAKLDFPSIIRQIELGVIQCCKKLDGFW